MRTNAHARRNGESETGLYLLSAVMFVVLYGLPLVAYLLEAAQR